MNERITKLFSCCLGNRVIAIETNFVKFHSLLKNVEPNCNSNRWYSDKFKESKEFVHSIDGKDYFFQQLV